MNPSFPLERLGSIELLVLDVDGVLTDGLIIVDGLGVESKHFHVKDGAAIALWHKQGKKTAILSGRSARCVDIRAAELGIHPVIQGASDKEEALRTLMLELNLKPDQTTFMGDDLADLPAMELAGFSACPSDGAAEVRGFADFVTQARGGRGAVRELVEMLLKAQGSWLKFSPTPGEIS